jgi:hypothetical protein
MNTLRNSAGSIRIMARITILATALIGPFAGLAIAQDSGARNLGGAGFVIYTSIMRNQ